MKIVLSPSKTKTITGVPHVAHLFPHITKTILTHLQALSVPALGKALKIKDDKAQSLYQFYQSIDTASLGAACESYDGIAFKYLDWTSLDSDSQDFGNDHLVIMSALYGAVEPMMGIGAYRLDMVDKIGLHLYPLWSDAMKEYFHKEDWILNLASKEYAKMIDHSRIVTVEFWERRGDVYKQMSTSSKMSRGLMARYCLEHQVETVSALPVTINGFTRITDVGTIAIPTESMTIRYEKEG